MEALHTQANLFASSDHFDKDTIGKKAVEVKERYEKLKAPMTSRKQKLTEAQTLQQFLRDIEDEEDWIREKEPIAASTNRGQSGDFTTTRSQSVDFTAIIKYLQDDL